MSKFIKTIGMFALLMTVAVQPLWAASTKDELAELKGEVQSLKEGQAAMQKDLADIKKLLQQGARAAPSRPAFKPTEVTIEGAPVLGAADAIVTLVEFSDYDCPFCRRHKDRVMPDLVKNFVDTGKLKYVMREFPLAMHPNAKGAAQAALCAGDQDQYWQMHDKMFENQRKLAMRVKPAAILVSPDPVFTAGKELLTAMVNQAWLTSPVSQEIIPINFLRKL